MVISIKSSAHFYAIMILILVVSLCYISQLIIVRMRIQSRNFDQTIRTFLCHYGGTGFEFEKQQAEQEERLHVDG